jgi:hypothetical protein
VLAFCYFLVGIPWPTNLRSRATEEIALLLTPHLPLRVRVRRSQIVCGFHPDFPALGQLRRSHARAGGGAHEFHERVDHKGQRRPGAGFLNVAEELMTVTKSTDPMDCSFNSDQPISNCWSTELFSYKRTI